MSLEEICDVTAEYGIDLVELTGGEPLAQPEAGSLLTMLCDRFGEVLLETSGAYPIADLDPRVGIIMDLKAPGSGEEGRNLLENLDHLKNGDELKLVLADRTDYLWAKKLVENHQFHVPVLFSPVHGELEAAQLAEWILEDHLKVRLHLQQHKFIWDPQERGR